MGILATIGLTIIIIIILYIVYIIGAVWYDVYELKKITAKHSANSFDVSKVTYDGTTTTFTISPIITNMDVLQKPFIISTENITDPLNNFTFTPEAVKGNTILTTDKLIGLPAGSSLTYGGSNSATIITKNIVKNISNVTNV